MLVFWKYFEIIQHFLFSKHQVYFFFMNLFHSNNLHVLHYQHINYVSFNWDDYKQCRIKCTCQFFSLNPLYVCSYFAHCYYSLFIIAGVTNTLNSFCTLSAGCHVVCREKRMTVLQPSLVMAEMSW